jgi:hypothetical protein
MYIKIRRRAFGKLAIASATTTVLANFAGKTLAQDSSPRLVGLSLHSINQSLQNRTTNAQPVQNVGNSINAITDSIINNTLTSDSLISRVVNEVGDALPLIDVNTTPSIQLQNLLLTPDGPLLAPSQRGLRRNNASRQSAATQSNTEIPSTPVQNPDTTTESAPKAVYTQDKERLTGASFRASTELITTVVASTQSGDVTRLITTNNDTASATKVSGFRGSNHTVESLLFDQTQQQLLAVVSQNEGTPPFEFAIVNPDGTIDYQVDMPIFLSSKRFSNLSLSPDGRIYATAIGAGDPVTLVEIDRNNRSIISGTPRITEVAPLSYNNKRIYNDLQSLAFSPFGQLYALANPDNQATNSLFTVNLTTGVLQKVTSLDVEKIAISP